MTFSHCTRCASPIVQRLRGGVAFVIAQAKVIDNLCGDCARAEGELQDERAKRADEQAERSGV